MGIFTERPEDRMPREVEECYRARNMLVECNLVLGRAIYCLAEAYRLNVDTNRLLKEVTHH